MSARTKGVLIRLSESELAELQQAAKIDAAPLATWARRTLRRRARRVVEAATPKGKVTP